MIEKPRRQRTVGISLAQQEQEAMKQTGFPFRGLKT
jgi:hypothetical protein